MTFWGYNNYKEALRYWPQITHIIPSTKELIGEDGNKIYLKYVIIDGNKVVWE